MLFDVTDLALLPSAAVSCPIFVLECRLIVFEEANCATAILSSIVLPTAPPAATAEERCLRVRSGLGSRGGLELTATPQA